MPTPQNTYNPNPELTQVSQNHVGTVQAKAAGPTDAVRPFDPRADSGFRLAEALGVAIPQLQKFNDDYEKNKAKEQEQKLSYYKEQIQQSREKDGNGQSPVTLAQIRQRFPETVPVIAMHLAEIIGQDDADKQMADHMEALKGDDATRLDTTARRASIDAKRAELMGAMPEGNDFYKNGFVKGMDRQIAMNEQQFAAETASNHQKVQSDGFTKELSEVILNKGSVQDLDAKWGNSSSLGPLERKKLIVNGYSNEAVAKGDIKMLDEIPDQFLNADSKAHIVKLKEAITQQRITDVHNAEWLDEKARQKKDRDDQQRILKGSITGAMPSIQEFMDSSPATLDYFHRMSRAPRLPAEQSIAASQSLRQDILNLQTTDGSDNVDKLSKRIMDDTRINPKEKEELLNDLPKLMQGRQIMNDPLVVSAFNVNIRDRIAALKATPGSQLDTMLTGGSMQADMSRKFRNEVSTGLQRSLQTTGNWPTGEAAQVIIDKATDSTVRRIIELSALDHISQVGKGKPAAAPAKPGGKKVLVKMPDGTTEEAIQN